MIQATNLDTIARPNAITIKQAGVRIAGALKEIAVTVFAVLCAWQERALMRSKMANLDDQLLDDIGLTREQVELEAAKPFWQT